VTTDQITYATYERKVPSRDATHPNRLFWAPEAEKFISKLSGLRVLEVGCWTGRDSQYFDEFEYVGIDLSERALAVAKQNQPNLRFQKADLYKLPFSDGTFDGVWAAAVYVHVPSVQIVDALKELHRVIKPNGIAWLAMHPGNFEGYVDDADGPRYFTQYSLEGFAQRLSSAGFIVEEKGVVDSQARGAPARYPNFLSYFARKPQL